MAHGQSELARMVGRPRPTHGGVAPVYRGAPILGALAHFRDDMLGTLVRAAELGPVVRFRLGAGVPIRTYGIFSPVGAARLLAEAGDEYRKDSRPYAETSAFLGDGLLTSQDERWQRQRRFVAPLFSRFGSSVTTSRCWWMRPLGCGRGGARHRGRPQTCTP